MFGIYFPTFSIFLENEFCDSILGQIEMVHPTTPSSPPVELVGLIVILKYFFKAKHNWPFLKKIKSWEFVRDFENWKWIQRNCMVTRGKKFLSISLNFLTDVISATIGPIFDGIFWTISLTIYRTDIFSNFKNNAYNFKKGLKKFNPAEVTNLLKIYCFLKDRR